MDLTALVGNAAIVCTVASNFAGLPICLDISRKKSTSGVSPLPFLAAAACASLWLQYGIQVKDTVVAVVNLIAACMQVGYLICFYSSTQEKRSIERRLMCLGAFLLFGHLCTFYLTETHTGIHMQGLLASGGSIAVSAAPLPDLGDVFQTRSTERLPFLTIFATFFVTLLWYIYGALVDDAFIKVPNLIGAVLSGFQLSLFIVFDSKSSVDKKQM